MDFSNFDPTEAILFKGMQLKQSPEEKPFIDENPCLLCGHKAFANFIDLTLVTSCTSQSSTPVRKKLRDILKKVWVQTKENNILCLACYDLVDRYDTLEAQLNNIRENIEEKYQETCAKKHLKVKPANSQKKRGRPKTKSNSKVGNKKKKGTKSDITSDDDKDFDFTNDNDANDDRGNDDSEYSAAENEMGHLDQTIDHKQQHQVQQQQKLHEQQQQVMKTPVPPAIPVEVPEAIPNLNVYDENHQMLQRGQKMRLGRLINENGLDLYKCGYCQLTLTTIAHLHNHVHSFHMPEVVDVAIPAELGLGNTMNCGIELQNVSEPFDCPKPWSCIFCDAAFRARTNMSSHFKEKHTPHKPFVCADCGEAFRKGIDLNRHKLYFCPERTVTFAPKRKYKKREPKDKVSVRKKQNKNDLIDHSE